MFIFFNTKGHFIIKYKKEIISLKATKENPENFITNPFLPHHEVFLDT